MGRRKNCAGLTLLEVLISLLITGIIAGTVLNLYLNQYRLAKSISAGADYNYSLLRAGQVLTSVVKTGEKVAWNGNSLTVNYRQDQTKYSDSYYLADKDSDGNLDLYREHLAVPNPIATGLTSFNCQEVSQGLWKIVLKAGSGEKEFYWERKVRQKCRKPE